MALFQSPTFSAMMHSTDNPSAPPLSSALPSAQSCQVSEILAFPSSLAALKHGIKWNASCWVANQRLNEFEQLQIAQYAFRGQQRVPHIEWCHFASDISSNISLIIVFPELQTGFRTAEILERWTDQVVLPAFRQLGLADSVLTSSFNVIRMTAEAEREETLNFNAPDTELAEVLSRKGGLTAPDMHEIWTLIQQNANRTSFFSGFRNLFLVAIYRPNAAYSKPLPMDEAWRATASIWDSIIDMAFVPVEYIRVNASAILHAEVHGMSSSTNLNGVENNAGHHAYAESLWESSRKRKVDLENETDKRAKTESLSSRPIMKARSLTIPASPHPTHDAIDAEMAD